MGAKLQTVAHIIEQQKNAEKEILNEYKKQNFSFDQPYVKVNPYLIAPLTAIIMFDTEEELAIDVTVYGKTEESNFHFYEEPTKEHCLCIFGLYPGMKNKVTMVASNGATQELLIETAETPSGLVTSAEVSVQDNSAMAEQLFFAVPVAGSSLTAGYDVFGDCRWYTTEIFSYHFNRSRNGRIFVGAPYLLAPPYSPTTLWEMSMIGKIYKEYRLPSGYHHGYFEKEDGNLFLLTQNIELGTSGDIIALMDRNNGQILKQWDLKEILPQDVAGSGSQDMHDWFHCNSVWYDEATHSLTLSGRHQDIIININEEDGALNWMLGDPEGWPEEYVQKYFLTPIGEFKWAYEPHAVRYLSEDTLICFDSGHYRAKTKENYVLPKNNYSRGVIYKINPVEKTVEQVWQHGEELGSKFYSPYMGDIVCYGEDHYGIHSGGSATLNGNPIDMPGMFSKDINPSTVLFSTTREVKNQQLVAEIKLPGNYYQVQRMKLFDDRDTLKFGEGQYIGTWAPTEEFGFPIPEVNAGMITDEYNLTFSCDGERLIVKGDFKKGEMVMLHLVGEKEERTFYIQSTRRPFYTMCLYTFGEGDDRPVEWPIYVADFDDCYRLILTINEKTYETGIALKLNKGETRYV